MSVSDPTYWQVRALAAESQLSALRDEIDQLTRRAEDSARECAELRILLHSEGPLSAEETLQLATYLAEVARGVTHTPTYVLHMAALQARQAQAAARTPPGQLKKTT